ncbi:MAG: hypothetical protein ACYCQM_10210 [Acidithiobacillus sp.]
MNKWKFLLGILVALFVAFWIGHQGHVGLGSPVSARDSVSDVVMTLPSAVAQAAS